MKILHITTGLENGGAEAILYRLVTGKRGGHTHEVVSLMGEGYYRERLVNAGVSVHLLQMPRGQLTFSALFKLYRLIRSFNPDVIQTWMYHADLVGGLVARFSGKRTVVWGVHHSNLDPGKTPRSTRLVARICALISRFVPTKIICCSEQAARVHIALGYNPSKMIVVHNGTDVLEFAPNSEGRARMRAEWQIGDNEVVLGMVARWDSQKDHANLVAASAYIKSRMLRPWRCMLIGPGMVDTNQEVVALLEKYEVRDYFHLLGARDDVSSVMNALDLHVLSSSGEAFGNVTIEAMSCGTPAVVTSVGAGATIVGETGWVVRPSDPEALGATILKAIDAMAIPETWLKRKVACRSRVVEHFSLAGMISAYHEAWETALAKTR